MTCCIIILITFDFCFLNIDAKKTKTTILLFIPSMFLLGSISLCVSSLIYMRGWLKNVTWKWIFKKPLMRVNNTLWSVFEIIVIWNTGDLSSFDAIGSLLRGFGVYVINPQNVNWKMDWQIYLLLYESGYCVRWCFMNNYTMLNWKMSWQIHLRGKTVLNKGWIRVNTVEQNVKSWFWWNLQ